MSSAAGTETRALVLCGGGIAGVAYEIGALRALDDLLVGATVNDFDILVGTSAGALVATLLANGLSPEEMARSFGGEKSPFTPPTRMDIYRPNLREVVERATQVPGVLRELGRELGKHHNNISELDIPGILCTLMPSGLFDPRGISSYLARLLESAGLSDSFARIEKELYIVACDLDADERVVFSRSNHPEVPVSQAVGASSAIPVLFRPMEIAGIDYVDGGIKGISAIDVAVEQGAKLIVVINPVVPIDASQAGALANHPGNYRQAERLSTLGMRAIYNQVFRGVLYDGLLDHIRLTRDAHPDVDIVLIQPRPDDAKMFFHELMSFSARLMVLEHGYESVSSGLYETWEYLRRTLPRHGIHITRRLIEQRPIDLPVETAERPGRLRRLMRETVFAHRPRLHVMDDEAI